MLWPVRDALSRQHSLTLPAAQLPAGWRGELGPAGLAVVFARPQCCLSSAVLNGGWTHTHGFLNMHLREDEPLGPAGPATRLQHELTARGLPDDSVGMMTGAWMQSMRLASAEIDGQRLSVLLTAGLSNARRAGERAEQRHLHAEPATIGTINIALASSVALSAAAMAETLTTLTEAKAAVMQTQQVTSALSGDLATGTGTDATAVFCPPCGEVVTYTGKHTLFGELAARLVIDALTDSLTAAREAAHAS